MSSEGIINVQLSLLSFVVGSIFYAATDHFFFALLATIVTTNLSILLATWTIDPMLTVVAPMGFALGGVSIGWIMLKTLKIRGLLKNASNDNNSKETPEDGFLYSGFNSDVLLHGLRNKDISVGWSLFLGFLLLMVTLTHVIDIAVTETATWYISIIIGVSLIVFIWILVIFRKDTGRFYLWMFIFILHVVAVISVGLPKSLMENELWPYLILLFNYIIFSLIALSSMLWLPFSNNKKDNQIVNDEMISASGGGGGTIF